MATVGELIVETLVLHGIDRVYCVPGESYLGLLDGLYGRNDIDTVVCRHESGAGFMALADSRLTQRPSVAMVSRGPGTCNAAIAVHTAQQDEVPFILLIGQVATADVRRDSFQEIDYGKMFGSIAKWVAEVTDPKRVPETLLRALQVATTGVQGPVVLAFPEDVLTSVVEAPPVRPQGVVRGGPRPADVAALRARLAAAERPLALLGPQLERDDGRARLLAFLEAWELPAVVSFRRQDLLPNAHRLYAGDMGLANPPSQMAALRDSDLLVVLGAVLTDITTQGYTFPAMVRPEMPLVHVHADPAAIGTHFAADLAIAADPLELMAAMGRPEAPAPAGRAAWIDRLKAEQRRIAAPRRFDVSDGVPMEAVIEALAGCLPPDAIVTADAGTFAAPVYRIVPFVPPQRLLAPIAGAMGFGIPAAVAAAMREPGRTVVCLVGDGGFAMTGSELAVALERGLRLKVILSENGIYASIRIHQERDYPGRTVGTSFRNPDLALIGQAYGLKVSRIATMADLARLPAIIAAPESSLVIVDTSIAAILPTPRA
ncbi:MAG: thiamine pyrophosphate-binding protein [Geminicoccaceae bacterium]